MWIVVPFVVLVFPRNPENRNLPRINPTSAIEAKAFR